MSFLPWQAFPDSFRVKPKGKRRSNDRSGADLPDALPGRDPLNHEDRVPIFRVHPHDDQQAVENAHLRCFPHPSPLRIPGTRSDPFGLGTPCGKVSPHVPDLTVQDFGGLASGHPVSSAGQAFEQLQDFSTCCYGCPIRCDGWIKRLTDL